jgi:hypothetical protein
MALDIGRNGIVQRHEDGSVTIHRPAKNGGAGTEIEVPVELADAYRLATGDVVEGETEPIYGGLGEIIDDDAELRPDWDLQIDEPSSLRGGPPRVFKAKRLLPSERLTGIVRINGLSPEEAEDRPFPRTKRSRNERVPPDLWLTLAASPDDFTGRMLDFAAPLGAGVFGLVYGPHGGGLSRTLQAALGGIVNNSPDCVPLVLLLRPRAEEATEWRRRVPGADIVVGAPAFTEGAPEETLRICTLVLEAAQRQTELGRDVVLLIDSLTTLWGTMLEAEEADAQQEADNSAARLRIREWAQRAGCFHGETPLGGGLRGSLTILGTVWNQATDIEAEEERDTHPHLRLLEHLLPESSWLVALSETLKQRRLYPAIDVRQCRSQYEERLLPADLVEPALAARGALPRRDPVTVHLRVMEALENSADLPGFLDRLVELNALTESEGDSPRSAVLFPIFPQE